MTTSVPEPGSVSNRTQALGERFRAVYRTNPQGIFRAPGRVNLIGEHTDYNDGFVMPAAIDFSCYTAVGGRSDNTLSIYSEQFQESAEFDLNHVEGPPTEHWSDYIRGVAGIMQEEGYPVRGANLLLDGLVPVGSGLSSSAAIEVSTALALASLARLTLPRLELARLCQRAENTYTGARCGIMDQFISCFGKQDYALMLDCRTLEATYLKLPANVFLVICNTMVRHELAAGEYNARRASCERVVETLRKSLPCIRALRDVTLENLEEHRRLITEVDFRRSRHVITENARVNDAKAALESSDLARFGQLMYLSHESLDHDYEVSCRELNLMVDIARKVEGVYGSRMTGGGFGGCTINLVESQMISEFRTAVARDYENLTGLSPQIFVSHPAAGASELPL